ncbi:MAG: biotin/lipoyl-binding protein [Anaerolineae bacterium]|nr:biotin/lipoyl-binding protein [Anaerolineae bacterium]
MAKLSVTLEGRSYTVEVPPLQADVTAFTVLVDGQPVQVTVDRLDGAQALDFLTVDGRPYRIDSDRDLRWISTQRGLHPVELRDLEAITTRPATGDGRVKAPIPGLIASIAVAVGQPVEVGQPLLILEAMKMQNELRAPLSGTVRSLHVEVGQVVARAQVLAEIEA